VQGLLKAARVGLADGLTLAQMVPLLLLQQQLVKIMQG
jgi:hypothetical protein